MNYDTWFIEDVFPISATSVPTQTAATTATIALNATSATTQSTPVTSGTTPTTLPSTSVIQTEHTFCNDWTSRHWHYVKRHNRLCLQRPAQLATGTTPVSHNRHCHATTGPAATSTSPVSQY